MVIQIVRVAIRPDQRNRWNELIQKNVTQTRSEKGCESYHVGEDLDAPNTFMIVERWNSLESKYAHFRTPEFGQMMGALGDVLAGPPEVSINEVANSHTLDEALAAAGVGR
jgi:quinol monooxygenase YgiN